MLDRVCMGGVGCVLDGFDSVRRKLLFSFAALCVDRMYRDCRKGKDVQGKGEEEAG